MLYTLPHAVDHAAARAPDSEAVRFEGTARTYAEVARMSNGLAAILRRLGVRRGDRVGIYMNKSHDSPGIMHGIMKAGGAYVPLDPFAPMQRVAYMIRDCGIRHLVTTDRMLERSALPVADLGALSFLVGASDRPEFECVSWREVRAAACDTAPDIDLTEQDLAYILYQVPVLVAVHASEMLRPR